MCCTTDGLRGSRFQLPRLNTVRGPSVWHHVAVVIAVATVCRQNELHAGAVGGTGPRR